MGSLNKQNRTNIHVLDCTLDIILHPKVNISRILCAAQ